MNTEKISSATPATTLRLPRSAHRARGTAHNSWATEPTKVTAPRAASWMWKECSRLVPMRAIPLPTVPGTRAASGQQHQGGVAVPVEDADQRRGLALTGAGHDGQVGDGLGIAALGDDLLEELVGNGEVEHHLVGH